MIKEKTKTYDVAVAIGRYQVPMLHEAHKEIIEFLLNTHKKVIVVLGAAPIKATKNNPLDIDSRRKMFAENYPEVDVLYISDHPSDDVWSHALDGLIANNVPPGSSVCLYGGRDSFIKGYNGDFDTKELESDRIISGTELRKNAGFLVKKSVEWRMGVIWATQNKYPTCYPCVDILPYDKSENTILLARKHTDPAEQYRTIGGFVNPGETFKQAAARELNEECKGIEFGGVKGLTYVDSFVINDWRYRGEEDKITSTLFICKYAYGCAKASDDIQEVRWFKVTEIQPENIIPEHREMVSAGITAILTTFV